MHIAVDASAPTLALFAMWPKERISAMSAEPLTKPAGN